MPEGISENLHPKKPRIRVLEEKSAAHESLEKETKVGEPKEGSPLIFFNDLVYKDVVDHLRGDLSNERGGILIGYIKQDGTSVNVTGFIPATSSQNASGVRFEFVHDDWVNFHKVRESRGRGEAVVGWVHSHPKIEPVPSYSDDFISQGFFNIPGMFSLIIDPVNNAFGVFRYQKGISVNVGGIILRGDLPNNGLTQMPRVTSFNSLADTLRSPVGIPNEKAASSQKKSIISNLRSFFKRK